ncbi:protein of unknown function (plasmid) [Methylocella tundrae]|uniref:Uncharacterized protein n=1 Tax=Methylocella tundrae TaxID=227605 RepID=A0A4V6IN65_METTU|nr:protein of unknown function [Methylocella tundrae]
MIGAGRPGSIYFALEPQICARAPATGSGVSPENEQLMLRCPCLLKGVMLTVVFAATASGDLRLDF